MGKQGFKELQVWQRAKKLAVNVYKLTTGGSMAPQYALAEQMRRSSISAPSNIAEGDERDTDKDSVRFFYISKGSLAELITQLEIAHKVGLLTAEQITPRSAECLEIGRMLGALIKSRSLANPTYRA
jgi:hypothetical protein